MLEGPMADEKNPFEAVQAMMLENLEKVQGAAQSYIDMFEKAMRGLPGADEDRIATFKAYLERQVAANHDFVEKLLRAKDFQEAFRIQVEYFQSQLKGIAESASKIGTQIASSFNRPTTG
jgi:transcription termination factor NusB